jgi:hypothetical protein
MLAEAMVRLQRPGKPQRYAMDPAHRQAIENYLALMTRGYGMPQAHRQATPVIDQRLGEVDAPLFHRLMAGLFQGDESVPGATLDLLRDRDIEPGTVHDIGNRMEYPQGHQMTPDDHFGDLLTRLVQAHHHLTGGLDVRGMFHGGHNGSMTADRVGTPASSAFNTMYTLAASLGNNHPGGKTLQQLADRYFDAPLARNGINRFPVVRPLVQAHDIASDILANPKSVNEQSTQRASGVVSTSSEALRRVLHHLSGQQPLES